MKMIKIYTILLIIIVLPSITYGQLNVIENTHTVVAELTEGRNNLVLRLYETELESEAQYFLTYRDATYTQIYSSQVHFIGNKETLSDLKNLILSLFVDDENEKTITVELGGRLTSIAKMRLGRRDVVLLMIEGKGHTKPLREREWVGFFSQLDD